MVASLVSHCRMAEGRKALRSHTANFIGKLDGGEWHMEALVTASQDSYVNALSLSLPSNKRFPYSHHHLMQHPVYAVVHCVFVGNCLLDVLPG